MLRVTSPSSSLTKRTAWLLSRRSLGRQAGQTMTEYATVLTVITVACLAALALLAAAVTGQIARVAGIL